MTENTNTTEVSIESFFADEMSPYGMRNSVNKILAALGVEKVLPGPMFYTYTKKGYIKTVPGSDFKKVSKADAIEWTIKYVEKLITKAAQVQPEEVVENEMQEALDAFNNEHTDEEVQANIDSE